MTHTSAASAFSQNVPDLFSLRVIPRISLYLLTVLFLSSPTAGAKDPVLPTETEMVSAMERHYEAAILGHDALIQGDIEMLRTQLAKLAKLELPDNAPPSWQPYHARLRESVSGDASRITSMESAGTVMGDVAESCGSCHAALNVNNIYFRPAAPAGDSGLQTTMRTHQWASERLWEGVTGPFAEAWTRGAEALTDTRIFTDKGDASKASLHTRENALREMGRTAKAATGLHERAVIYGRLLTACAGCHQAAGVSIAPAKSLTPWQKD